MQREQTGRMFVPFSRRGFCYPSVALTRHDLAPGTSLRRPASSWSNLPRGAATLSYRAGLLPSRLADDTHRHAFESAQCLPLTCRSDTPQYRLTSRPYRACGPVDESESLMCGVSIWLAFRRSSSRRTPWGMPSACLRKLNASSSKRYSNINDCLKWLRRNMAVLPVRLGGSATLPVTDECQGRGGDISHMDTGPHSKQATPKLNQAGEGEYGR